MEPNHYDLAQFLIKDGAKVKNFLKLSLNLVFQASMK